ncbi:sodium:calcium antiporter [Fulvimonas sp. R45]|uniref:sodium:calcium antiporter n=1 Tax=Fulvimonas sp. R45 TaxID=3045937 RepID=UPI00265F9815|nr:sodium:calcium antiporter [Fulvimonas sp. R45]MDO1527314.1 sodium:calcium antiporter [Fulvimonas sp. R45]
MSTALLFLLSAGAIYVACEYFVNGVEWLGRKLDLGATATGTVLAAFGTALPESAVTFVAVVFGKTPQARDIGVGAALGGPLVLATIAYAVVGLALWANRRRLRRDDGRVRVDHRRLARDQAWFLAIFVAKCALGLVVFALKPWLGVLFLAAYALYVWREVKQGDTAPEEEELEPLKFQPRAAEPSMARVLLQAVLALVVIALASRVFVGQLEVIGVVLGMPPHLVALLLSPVATELPETVNALIWVRQGKERLALANISGAMMIQATVPSALAIFATPWLFDVPLMVAGALTVVAVGYLWWLFRRGHASARWLMPVGLLYGVFAMFVTGYFAA